MLAGILLANSCFTLQDLPAQTTDDSAAKSRPALPADPASVTRQKMIERMDTLLSDRWKQAGIEPARPADDYEFLRRICLDLTGTIPTVHQIYSYTEDKSQPRLRRRKLVEQLLDSPSYATHLATTWRMRMLPEEFDPQQLNMAEGLQSWLRKRFAANRRFDDLVADFLVATGTGDRGPGLYYTAMELKPERLAANTARIFLGLQIQCAQCHDHPFDDWLQEEFWGYAAFFARVKQGGSTRMSQNDLLDAEEGEVTLPATDRVILPRYPKGSVSDDSQNGTRRRRLAIWTVSRDNPYMARATVNWAWSHMFGRGLVDPIDDFSKKNPPSHPELLDELAAYFVATEFDLKELLRTLALTDAYALSSETNDTNRDHPEAYACMATKVLTPEQLYDSLSIAIGSNVDPQFTAAIDQPDFFQQRRRDFLSRMRTNASRPTEYEGGLPQALLLMNGAEISNATDGQTGRLIASLDAPFFSDEQKLETLFLATVSRKPSDAEKTRLHNYLDESRDANNRQQALSDILWALFNSAEFTLNH